MPRAIPKKKARPRRKPPANPAAPPRTLVSASRFAAELGVSEAAVRKAIADGRLSGSVRQETRGARTFRMIDLEEGRREWAKNTGPRKETGQATVSLEPEDLDAGPPGAGVPPAAGRADEINFAEERARKERALADRHELTAAQLRGDLISRELVERAMMDLGRRVRERLAGFAAELPDELHMKRSKEVAIVLERATAEVAAELARELEALAPLAVRDSA